MRNPCKLTLVLACGGIILAGPLPAAVDFWVNACCLNTTAVSGGGQMKTVSVHVGTNETDANASLWVAYVILQVKGSDGFQCSTQGFQETYFHPMVAMPIRFQVVYAKPPTLVGKDDILLPPHKRIRPVKYTMTATITKITPLSSGTFPPGDAPGNNSHTVPYDLPSGGTPTCVNVAGPN